MKKINKFKTTKTHLGIQVLRFLLCFWVVIIHCSFVEKEHRKYLCKNFHVPTFFVLSFYFYYPIISSKNIEKIISRFQRLLLPYIFWPFAGLILVSKKFRLKDIFLQLLIGKPIHGVFWFQFNLIFLSLFFAIILFTFNKKGINILMLIGLFCYFLHLTGLVYNILLKYKSFVKTSIGCLLEMMPLAVNGSILKSKNLFSIEKQYSIFFNFFLFCALFILFNYDIFLKKQGFLYPNVSLNIISSLILFLFFGTLSFEKIKKQIYIILKYTTQFTGGIYYTHTIIRDILKKYSLFKSNYTFSLKITIFDELMPHHNISSSG